MSNNKKNTPSLDLSFAYGTSIIKKLSEQDIRMFQAAEAAGDESSDSDDPTIRTVTSLFTGTRGIKGLTLDEEDPDRSANPVSKTDDEP